MQEDIQQKSVAIAVKGGKLTGRLLKQAIATLIRRMEKARETPSVGQNSMKRLVGKDGSANSIDVSGRIQSFERIARKYNVRYHIKKDIGSSPMRWTVYFKANQADALTAAFKEYSRSEIKRDSKPSVLAQLNQLKELVKNAVVDRVKKKEHGGPEL